MGLLLYVEFCNKQNRTSIQMMFWKQDNHLNTWHLNTRLVKVHYSDDSILQMSGFQIPTVVQFLDGIRCLIWMASKYPTSYPIPTVQRVFLFIIYNRVLINSIKAYEFSFSIQASFLFIHNIKIVTWINDNVSQLENASQNAKNVCLFLVRESQQSESVFGRQKLWSIVHSVDDGILALWQVDKLKLKNTIVVCCCKLNEYLGQD